MNEQDLKQVFLRHLAMAIPWGIVFLVAFFVAAYGITQQVKEGIEFTAVTFSSVMPPEQTRAPFPPQHFQSPMEPQ